MIVQIPFDMPDDIGVGIATGAYKLSNGGVVRWATGKHKGEIVKHLKQVDISNHLDKINIKPKPVNPPAKVKKGYIIVGLGIAAAGLGYCVYQEIKNHESKEVKKFKKCFDAYVNATRTGNMNIELIDNLMLAIRDLQNLKNYEKINIGLTAEELAAVFANVYRYTIAFADANNYDLSNENINNIDENKPFEKLEENLCVQKKILECCA